MKLFDVQGNAVELRDDQARIAINNYRDKIVLYLTQVRDALNDGDVSSAIAKLDEAILDFSTLG